MCRLFTDRINRCTGRDNGCCGQCACVTNLEQPRFRSCRMITNNGDIGNLHEELHEHGRGTASMHTVTGHCGNTRSHKVAYKLYIVTMQGCSGHCGNLEVGQVSYQYQYQYQLIQLTYLPFHVKSWQLERCSSTIILAHSGVSPIWPSVETIDHTRGECIRSVQRHCL
jgi:hypothetical protein